MLFTSHHPIQQKRNIVYNLVDRAFLLSDKSYHKQNRKIITDILLANKYPLHFINTYIDRRLKKINFIRKNKTCINNVSQNVMLPTVSVPLCSEYSKISRMFKKYNIRTMPTLNKQLRFFITLGKDKLKTLDRTNVVYKFSCKQCAAVYVGQTKRALRKRKCEHKNNSKTDAVINVHKNKYKHDFDWDHPTILDNESHWYKRTVSEMIFIKTHTNAINKKEECANLSNVYTPILKYIM